LCFHNKPAQNSNYFFAGNALFYEEWSNFSKDLQLRNKSTKNYEFSVIPLSSVNSSGANDSYNFNYDMEIFNNYDGNPIKVYKTQINDFCEVYTGDYFVSR